MVRKREIFYCKICGNTVEAIEKKKPDLICCGQRMETLEPKNQDTGNEKHVPVISELNDGIEVTVGSVEHPMEDKHYIKFIEVLTNDRVLRIELSPGQKPSAKFSVPKSEVIEVREFCNLHGLWKN